MTREEAKLILENMIHDDKCVYGDKPKKKNEALSMAISALSAEGEYIKKEDVLAKREILRDENGTGYQAVRTKYIRELPTYSFPDREKGTDTFFREATKEERESVDKYIKSISFPDREKGEWIEVIDHESEISKTWHYECSVCSKPNPCMEKPNFCPNCGADMKKGENE